MTNQELEQYLHQHISLSAAMQVTVKHISSTSLTLEAPLAPNINHQETVFGGSASTLAILSAWSLLHTRLKQEQISAGLVIQRNEIAYLTPMQGDFSATAVLPEDEQWTRFLNMLRRKGKARLQVTAGVYCGTQLACRFSGEYVAFIRGN